MLRGILEEDRLRKGEVVVELKKILEEISWKQKSWALWLKECNKCAKFCHCMMNPHNRDNEIEVLQSGDSILLDPLNIKNHIINFYGKLFREDYS